MSLEEAFLLAGMFTGVLEPQSGKLQILLCSHEANENECPTQQIRAALRKTKLKAFLLELVFL